MLSYRHAFHAGNHADVLKHWVLTLILEALCRKDKPFFVLDTHAGAGRYDLHASRSQKTLEFQRGIGRLWGKMSEIPSLAAYAEVLGAMPGQGSLRWYPGSPWIIRHFLRAGDRLVLSELHPEDVRVLSQWLEGDSRVRIEASDGYEVLKACVPPRERRGLIHIDPAFERKDEISRLLLALSEAHRRWASGSFAVWYPIQGARSFEEIPRGVRRLGIPKTLQIEYELGCEDPQGLKGSGMILINPPYLLKETLSQDLPKVLSAMAQGSPPRFKVEWLVPEAPLSS